VRRVQADRWSPAGYRRCAATAHRSTCSFLVIAGTDAELQQLARQDADDPT
jgi:hypothetical protein